MEVAPGVSVRGRIMYPFVTHRARDCAYKPAMNMLLIAQRGPLSWPHKRRRTRPCQTQARRRRMQNLRRPPKTAARCRAMPESRLARQAARRAD